ncbi:MAG TPA: glycoside hydrolase family 38 C-terminal domain-containing protein, partial [Streptomyces sp.]
VGPTDEDIETTELLSRLPGIPDTAFGSASDYFTGLREKVDASEIPVHRGELYLEAHRGTYTAQGRTKSAGRDAEWSLVTAEALQAMHTLVGGSAQPATDDWRTVLDCQAHDVITGVSIAEVHTDAETRLRDIARRAKARQRATTRLLARAVAPRGATPGFAVANPTLSERPLRLRVPADWNIGQRVGPDTRVLTAPDPLPPLSVTWREPVADVPAPAAATPTGGGVMLENSEVRLLVGRGGAIDRLHDKRTGRDVLTGPGNVLSAWLDRPHFWDAWELSAEYRGCPLEPLVCESVETVESGPHRAAVRIRLRFRDSTVVQDIRLWAGSARVDIRTEIDWHERRVALRAGFPVPTADADAIFECPYGVVHRPTSPEPADSDAQFEVPGQRFAAVEAADGWIALLNNGRYGHRVRNGELSLTLLRSPVFPDPSCDEGRQQVTYAVLPYRGGWLDGGVLAEAEDLNAPLTAERWRLDRPGTWQALGASGLPLGLGAFKAAEDGDGLVLRVYEPAGRPGAARVAPPDGWRIHEELDLLEDSAGAPAYDFRPHQIRSWRLVPDGPRRMPS